MQTFTAQTLTEITVDVISSVAYRLPIERRVRLSDVIPARVGTVVVVELLTDKEVYNQLELADGSQHQMKSGDIVLGVLGERNALRGYAGIAPDAIAVGDTLQMLNIGGVIGQCTATSPQYGDPFDVKILGAVVSDEGTVYDLANYGVQWRDSLGQTAPIILVSGTCMNSGKTSVASAITSHLTAQGYKVGFAKLTGVGLRRDLFEVEDAGAVGTVSFIDAGLPSTANADDTLGAAKGILYHLNETLQPDIIIAELGDGILGGYKVDNLLSDSELSTATQIHVLCANDPVGAWGAKTYMETVIGSQIDMISGPVTDNAVGTTFCAEQLQISAANINNTHTFGNLISEKLAS